MVSALPLDFNKVSSVIPGVNHFVWLNDFYYDGENAFPILDKWIETDSKKYFENCTYCDFMGPKVIDLYKRYGVFPIGDTANPGGGAWGYEYHSSREIESDWNEDPETWFNDYFEASAGTVSRIEETAYDDTKKVRDLIGCEKSHEPMIPIIESLGCGIEQTIVVNVLNAHEYVPGIPTNFAVEVPARCGKYGIQPIGTRALPQAILARAYHDRVAPVEIELAAYDSGSKELLIDLVMMDPFTRNREQAAGLVEEILNLPYHKEMKEWYR